MKVQYCSIWPEILVVVIPVILGERDRKTFGTKSSRPYWQKALKDQIRLKEGSEQQTCCFGVWLGVYYSLKGADMMRVG